MTANPVARHLAIIDDMLANANRRSGIGLPRGIDLTLHRPPSARVGAARYQEFFDAHATDPSPWSIEDMLPDYVLADRAIPQLPRMTFVDTVIGVSLTADVRAEGRIQNLLATIPIPVTPYQWTAHVHGTVVGDPPPWMRAHREALGLPVDDHPQPDTGARGDWVLLILCMIALGGIVAWIILEAIR